VAKAGTPTMGGLLLIGAAVAASLICMDWGNPLVWIVLAAAVSFGLVGAVDDYSKIRWRSAYRGLTARGRLIIEFVLSCAVAGAVLYFMPSYLPPMSVGIPIINSVVSFGLFYFIFAYLVIAGAANATNISDGMDGVLSKMILPVIAVLAIVAVGAASGSYLDGAAFIPGALGLLPVFGAFAGAIFGFLWFNAAPAMIFMGDVGSLALGAMAGTAALALKAEFVFAIAAMMMVIILASSFLQTVYYKITGRRIFRMSPLHHHFEQGGTAETKITARFAIMSVIFAIISLLVAMQ
jgi:phospho-N-acetylmuramoyl-pentapeptide-transferase